jgi:hypothetical protein
MIGRLCSYVLIRDSSKEEPPARASEPFAFATVIDELCCTNQPFRRGTNVTEGLNLVIWHTGDVSGSLLAIKLTSRDRKIADWLEKQQRHPLVLRQQPLRPKSGYRTFI